MSSSRFLSSVGCQLPLIQAPMAGVQDSRLTVAVCQAGGLGSLPCAMLTREQIENEISYIRSNTDYPFNVNFFAHHQIEYTEKMEKRWFEVLKPYYEQLGLTKEAIVSRPRRT